MVIVEENLGLRFICTSDLFVLQLKSELREHIPLDFFFCRPKGKEHIYTTRLRTPFFLKKKNVVNLTIGM